MSKFKVGDIVRRISGKFTCYDKTLEIGEIDTVVGVNRFRMIMLKNSCPDNFEACDRYFDLVEDDGLNAAELLTYVKANGITKARITEKFNDIPKDTILYFGQYNNCTVDTHDHHTESKNREFGYDFKYGWNSYWRDKYNGKFVLVDEDVPENPVEEDVHKFKAGDIVRFKSSDSKNAMYFKKGLENLEISKHLYDDYTCCVLYESDKSTTWIVDEDELELQSSKKKLIDNNMEEIKTFSKAVLVEAEEAALEEIKKEQVEMAKAEFKRMHLKVVEAEKRKDAASDELKAFKADLKALAAKK